MTAAEFVILNGWILTMVPNAPRASALAMAGEGRLKARVTPADYYFGRAEQILKQREEIKRKTMNKRRLRHKTENA